MEKKLYELKIDEEFEHILPPPQEAEINGLTQQLLDEGCRDALVTWNGVIIDGHNRYRICHENSIPFSYVEMQFEDKEAAKLWIIRNQLARRNVPPYVRCELVLPLEAELRAIAKKGQGKRNDLKNILTDLSKSSKRNTRKESDELAGVSEGTFDKAKKLATYADEETKDKLRTGEVSISKAFDEMKGKKDQTEDDKPHHSSLVPREGSMEPVHKDFFPGHGLVKDMPPMEEGAYVRQPDSVYDIPPIEVYGNMPSDDMELRGRAEFVHAKSDLTDATGWYKERVNQILRGISAASANEENIEALCGIVSDCCEEIISALIAKLP